MANTKTVDPYWSLFGRLKSNANKLAKAQRMEEEADEIGGGWYEDALLCGAEEIERNISIARLPLTGHEIELHGNEIQVANKSFEFKSASHAVNKLRKIDTDSVYRDAFLGDDWFISVWIEIYNWSYHAESKEEAAFILAIHKNIYCNTT